MRLLTRRTLWKPFGLFFISIFVLGLGISLVTLADLGTTAITSPPYVLSLFTPLSFGMYTMLFNILYVLLELSIMRGDFKKIQYFQLLVGPILGTSIDFWSVLVDYLSKPHYLIQLFMVISGCFIIACSIILQLKANVINNPVEGVVKAISLKTNIPFSTVKICFDMSLVCLALLTSWFAFGTIRGMREGTIISAILVGLFIKWMQKTLTKRKHIKGKMKEVVSHAKRVY